MPAILVFFNKTHNGNAKTIEDAKHVSNDGSKGSTDGMKYDLGRYDALLDSFGGKVESNDGSKDSTDGMKYDLGRDRIFFDTDLASDVEISSSSDSSNISEGSSFYAYDSNEEGNDEGVC